MATIDISRHRASLLGDPFIVTSLPPDLLAIIRDHTSPRILDAISEAVLIPRLTDHIFVYLEDVFSDICARWLLRPAAAPRQAAIMAALARVLPFAHLLAVFLEHDTAHGQALSDLCGGGTADFRDPASVGEEKGGGGGEYTGSDPGPLVQNLLAVWRLNSFDLQLFRPLLSPERAQQLFSHEHAAVRYLSIRIFCQQLAASDFKLEALVKKHLPDNEPAVGDFDGRDIDYGFLSLFERARFDGIAERRSRQRQTIPNAPDALLPPVVPQPLCPLVVCYGQAVLPRYPGSETPQSKLIMTETTRADLERLARMLQRPDPILVSGPPGSGKSALISEVARAVRAHSSMVTLHLNEQTDAKILIGLYTAGPTPGSFHWRPGILTTAVREGRWVLIEDLDRAPNDVLSTILPLVERRELLIPNRGERIRAPRRFRLFATVRSARGSGSHEAMPHMLGARFWQQLAIQAATEPDRSQIIAGLFPILRTYVPDISSVYGRLSVSKLAGRSSVTERQPNLRDLLKWCRRLQEVLLGAGSRSGNEAVSEATLERMFMEAVDVFVGSLPRGESSEAMIYQIAEEMRIARPKISHFLESYMPPHEERDTHLTIGRAVLRKRPRSHKPPRSSPVFANTGHAKRLMEQIAVAVNLAEPVLLVGETGIGKTAVVQQLAESVGTKLVVVNLSQQSESSDLLGGFKPVSVRSFAVPLKEEFEHLFSATGISASKNQKYLDQLGRYFSRGQWSRVSKLWREAPKMFHRIHAELEAPETLPPTGCHHQDQPPKRRRVESRLETLKSLKPRWESFSRSLDRFDAQAAGNSNMAFSFIEGNIVKAARNGDWVLLDEINLATADTLEAISDLLTADQAEAPSILLSDTGEVERIKAHPGFRIFGAMNPATDVGKRHLPLGIRSRFTEFYVSDPDRNLGDLLAIIKTYLGSGSREDQVADDVARLYLSIKQAAEEKRLADGADEVPHFSLRTLTRVLVYVKHVGPAYGLRRALYEGFSMGFLTLLNRESERLLLPLMHDRLLAGSGASAQALLSQPPRHPADGKAYVRLKNTAGDRQYWVLRGEQDLIERTDYVITASVERNLLNLVRATSTRRFPILIQGPTSAGKTSMIEYLAHFSGNRFVRINNHEHTDLQEYLGTYVSGPDGRLLYRDGLLVEAIRRGYWIVLDELNLAPTDVLEALNRLLDDNRELLIPETQEVVRPHENFVLFATQNPPGLYGGRKVLSRAFRNRFLELHFDDIPEDELEAILRQRSRTTSPSDCGRIVAVYKELSRLRQTSRLFEQKESFATLRDLFRWAQRDADDREQIAANGFMLIAERVRDPEERVLVKSIIERVFKVAIDPEKLYDAAAMAVPPPQTEFGNRHGVVWTRAMRRLFILVSAALKSHEPVLLVGETGCGKTTVCQLLAERLGNRLHIVNAHQNTETGDLIGSQRPVRNRAGTVQSLEREVRDVLEAVGREADGDTESLLRVYHTLPPEVLRTVPKPIVDRIAAAETRARALFEWSDGSLVEAMKKGHLFLLDEISLAEDSVLERLNSVLEPGRSLLLAEKGTSDVDDDALVIAADGFQFLATMNPGGDFGKRELSPALRNRFTEIWVPPLTDMRDFADIIRARLRDSLGHVADPIIRFATWFGQTYRSSSSTPVSMREILVWVGFVAECDRRCPLDSGERGGGGGALLAAAIIHGAATVFIDGLGANPSAVVAVSADRIELQRERRRCLDKLAELLECDAASIYHAPTELIITDTDLTIGGFGLPRTPMPMSDHGFAFHAPTTRLNAMRVVRALQMTEGKPVLLEGSPGVGKTTLVAALAAVCGRPLTRINLSDQTDLMDLFGADAPVEGADAGSFAWREGPFLRAMQSGGWVLLDEMNLATQSVLEGLNACLDHRGEVYVSELDQVFRRHPDFRLFAAQNPHHQGGGRKGLPSSFVNRFVVVYADVFSSEDLELIAAHGFPDVDPATISGLVRFVSALEHRLGVDPSFGAHGGPWEFNLRDILRWLGLLSCCRRRRDPPPLLLGTAAEADLLDLVIRQRFRTDADRGQVSRLFDVVFGAGRDTDSGPHRRSLYHDVSPEFVQVGLALMRRDLDEQPTVAPPAEMVPRLLAEAESLLICVQQAMPCILTGSSGAGKSALLQHVAAVAGKSLVVFPLSADTDTMDLVGGFEQADPQREINAALRRVEKLLASAILSQVPGPVPEPALELTHLLRCLRDGRVESAAAVAATEAGVISAAEALSRQVSRDLDLGEALRDAIHHLKQPRSLPSPRFEWLDGVIVQAMQSGQWLVLDNANLCSASVLDRLNSLLEPDGHLSINEHCEPGGEPRIIRPHPEFRVFLTVDPRYGDLSRAMRNRAVEIHIGVGTLPSHHEDYHCSGVPSIEGRLQRFHRAWSHRTTSESSRLALDNLSAADLALLPRYAAALQAGAALGDSDTHRETVVGFLRFMTSPDAALVREACIQMYAVAAQGLEASQPVHLLNNPPVTRLLKRQGRSDDAIWLAATLECFEQLQSIRSCIELQSQGARSGMALDGLNRLQRSFFAKRSSSNLRDSTANAADFLLHLVGTIEIYLRGQLLRSRGEWITRRHLLRTLILYLTRTLGMLTRAAPFDEAVFLAHLAQGQKLLRQKQQQQHLAPPESPDAALVAEFLDHLSRDFAPELALTTGLSMERLWRHFMPAPIPTLAAISQCTEIERLAVRLDSLRWRARATVGSVIALQSALSSAYRMVRNDGCDASGLIDELASAVGGLESKTVMPTGNHVDRAGSGPLLSAEFEALRKILALQSLSCPKLASSSPDHRVLLVLSDFPTVEHLRLGSVDGPAALLQSVDHIFCRDSRPDGGDLTRSLLSKLQQVRTVRLGSLALLETELSLVGRYISQLSADITTDSLEKLSDLLSDIMVGIVAAHGEALRASFLAMLDKIRATSRQAGTDGMIMRGVEIGQQVVDDAMQEFWGRGEPASASLARVMRDHFIPALCAAAVVPDSSGLERKLLSAISWLHLGIGAIELYVPDGPIDPQLSPMLAEQFQADMREMLRAGIASLEDFEQSFTGHRKNLRTELLEQELVALGEPPPPMKLAYRPQPPESAAQLGHLLSIFKNVLRIAGQCHFTSADHLPSAVEEGAGAARDNVGHLLGRLRTGFVAYQDVTRPAVGFLRCLELGLSLTHEYQTSAEEDRRRQQQAPGARLLLLRVIPFLGGRRWDSEPGLLPALSSSLEFFSLLNAIIAVEGWDGIGSGHRLSALESIHAFYLEWSRKVEADRRAEESKASLFRFRGSIEDEEQMDDAEFRELFPAYDEDNEGGGGSSSSSSSTNAASTRVADAHARLFLEPNQNAISSLEHLLDTAARHVIPRQGDSELASGSGGLGDDGKYLVGALFVLDRHLKTIAAATATPEPSAADYDFYWDANLAESRSLAGLVDKIRARFEELQAVDEIAHMQPLADVLAACDKVMDLAHSSPLAQVLPQVESLHGFVYEWQFGGWARSIHSVLGLHTALTETIVRWRRLELSTWARLLEAELRRCREEAKAWWFVAYELIVAYPASIADSSSGLDSYARRLVGDLEMYLSGAILGQFASRLGLVRQLQRHLALLAAERPSLLVVADAVLGFICHYDRFEPAVHNAIQRGRLPIEKSIKDVLLVASWKDTNMAALRESARRSHMKLFRIVRKWRAVLGQEAKPLIEAGIASSQQEQRQRQRHKWGPSPLRCEGAARPLPPPADAEERLEPTLPGWLQHHRRLLNVTRTVSIMEDAGAVPASTVDAGEALDEFVADLRSAMLELRTDTPTVLTEENAAQVKHLKTLKRKLFADTLRRLRDMGFRRSLSVASLSGQDSLGAVLASTPPVLLPVSLLSLFDDGTVGTDRAGCCIDADYHAVLDLTVKARAAARDHSSDLTEAETGRSLGYLEGILQTLLGQRRTLGAAGRSLAGLETLVTEVRELADQSRSPLPFSTLRAKSKSDWIQVLRWLNCILGLGVQLVEMHGRIGACDNGPAVEQLREWSANFSDLSDRVDRLATNSASLVTSSQGRIEHEFADHLDHFRKDLNQLAGSRQDLAFIIGSILPWTTVRTEDTGEPTDPPSPPCCSLEMFANHLSSLCDRVLVAFEKLTRETAVAPGSTEAPAWVASYDHAARSMIQALHVESIVQEMRLCLSEIPRATDGDSPETVRAISMLLALALPIFEQYFLVYRQRFGLLLDFHLASARMALELTQAFIRIAADGFCTPPEKSDEAAGSEGKLEAGTGLGEGEGQNDISKDVDQDEDLSELAREPNKEPREGDDDMEDVEDAVDMAGEEMEGETGSARGREDDEDENRADGSDQEDDDAVDDEEAGTVDDLDPTAVDEKMWDGGDREKAEKEQQGRQEKGKQDRSEQVAAQDGVAGQDQDDHQKGPEESSNNGDGEDDEMVTHEPEDVRPADEANMQDQHVPENDALALPDDMELDMDGNDSGSSGSDDDLDDLLSDMADEAANDGDSALDGETEEAEPDLQDIGADEEAKTINPDGADDHEAGTDDGERQEAGDVPMDDSEDAGAIDGGGLEEEADPESRQEPEPEGEDIRRQRDKSNADAPNAAPSEVRAAGGLQSADDDNMDTDADPAFRDQTTGAGGGGEGEEDGRDEAMTDASTGPRGRGKQARAMEKTDKQDEEPGEPGVPGEPEDPQSRPDPFRKLGDALERWHRQQRGILEAGSDQDLAGAATSREFEHLRDETAPSDGQALGAAKADDARPIDEAMGIDDDADLKHEQQVMSRATIPEQDGGEDELAAEEAEDAPTRGSAAWDDGAAAGPKARKEEAIAAEGEDRTSRAGEDGAERDNDWEEEDPDETTAQLLAEGQGQKPRELRDYSECLRQWATFRAGTQPLSATLSSQLRLILAPSRATKLSGGYRTGKRLSVKRIIPYIASGYRRDRIWMRRAVPTRREYQILLCVDDSGSMGEPGGGGEMALESLVMVSRALAMAEAGDVGVLGFGGDVFAARELGGEGMRGGGGEDDVGARVLRQFTFAQDRTDMALLMRGIIDRFRAARGGAAAATASGGISDVRQLGVILSDGLTPSSEHDRIRRLLREAAGEGIMVVFVVIDEGAGGEGGGRGAETGAEAGGVAEEGKKKKQRGGDSVLDLREAKFVPDGRGGCDVVVERYLDTFPFGFYVVVRRLEELPGALGGVLQGWFGLGGT